MRHRFVERTKVFRTSVQNLQCAFTEEQQLQPQALNGSFLNAMYDNHQKTQKESTEFDSSPYKGAHEVLSSELQQPQHLTADALFWGVTYTEQTRPRQHAFQLQNEPPDEGQDVSDVQKDEELQCIEAENLSTLNLTSETQKQGQDHTSSKT